MKKALLIYGGWEGHEPEKCIKVVKKELTEANIECILSNTLDAYLDIDLMNSIDLIVQCWTMGQITKEQLDALMNTVKNGTGLAGWHGGLCDAFRNEPDYQLMVGGQWVAHPGGETVRYTVNITNRQDTITDGLEDFTIQSEQYYMHVDPAVEVLATTTFKGDQENVDWIAGVEMPVVWKKQYFNGRVFYCSLGHNAKDFALYQVPEIIKRGCLWAAK